MIAAAIAVVDDRYGDERCGRLPSQWMTVAVDAMALAVVVVDDRRDGSE